MSVSLKIPPFLKRGDFFQIRTLNHDYLASLIITAVTTPHTQLKNNTHTGV